LQRRSGGMLNALPIPPPKPLPDRSPGQDTPPPGETPEPVPTPTFPCHSLLIPLMCHPNRSLPGCGCDPAVVDCFRCAQATDATSALPDFDRYRLFGKPACRVHRLRVIPASVMIGRCAALRFLPPL
jgi:hypothetical protein